MLKDNDFVRIVESCGGIFSEDFMSFSVNGEDYPQFMSNLIGATMNEVTRGYFFTLFARATIEFFDHRGPGCPPRIVYSIKSYLQ